MTSVGEAALRETNIDKTVTGFALRRYIFKPLCTIESISAWKSEFQQETKADLTNADTPVAGVPRLTEFPHGEVSWTDETSVMTKHGMTGIISYEDATSNKVDVISRTLKRIARAVVKSVDTNIWNVLTENVTPVNINTLAIAAGSEWNSATIANQNPLQNIFDAKVEIEDDDYDPDASAFLLLNPKDHANLIGNQSIRNAGQFWTADPTRVGSVGKIANLTVLVSNNVTADKAAIVIAKEACTWKQFAPLRTVLIEDPMISWKIRSGETGVAELRNPLAVCLITNTAKT